MTNCIYLKTTDTSINNNDIFDHPSYKYFCNKKNKEIIPCICCKTNKCKNYKPIGIYVNEK